MKRLWLSLLPLAAVALLAVPGCNEGLGVVYHPRIEIYVSGSLLDWENESVDLVEAMQLPETKTVDIRNSGDAVLIIDSIDWLVDADTGATQKNPHVALNKLGLAFPIELEADESATVEVTYTPPVTLDDFTPSVLLITSNAMNEGASATVPEVLVTFEMPTAMCQPNINPPNGEFTNATPTKPETIPFRIENELGTASFTVQSVALTAPSNVFEVREAPLQGTQVLTPTDPSYEDMIPTFKVVYTPSGSDTSDDTGQVAVLTSCSDVPYYVSLAANVLLGNYSLSFDHADKFDFSAPGATGCRRVQVMSEGPGVLKVSEPEIQPEEARVDFSWKAFLPQTSPETPEVEVCSMGCDKSFPQAFAASKSIIFEICYSPSGDPTTSANGEFIIPITKPDAAWITMPLWAGTPKPKLDIAPITKLVWISTDFDSATTGQRSVAISNIGNGDLVLTDLEVLDAFGMPGKVFELVDPTVSETPIAPGEVRLVQVAWDRSKVTQGIMDVTENLSVSYVHPFTQQETSEGVTLKLVHTDGNTPPSVSMGTDADYPDAAAGEVVVLKSVEPSSGSYDFPAGVGFAYWYLTGKPAASQAILNEEGYESIEFRPDVAGTYEVELFVYASQGSELLYSEPATLSLTVD